MKITAEQVLNVAKLARLKIDPSAVDKLARQVAGILDYVDTLGRVDTKDVAATSHAIALTNAFREDVEQPHLSSDQALANAPAKENGFFVVPKII